jgi:MFS family permease
MLQITVVWFAIFTFLCGFAQTYNPLLACRALMWFGFGGEWAVGSVLMGEIISAQHRGKAVSTVQSGWAIGWAVAAILSTVHGAPAGYRLAPCFGSACSPRAFELIVKLMVFDAVVTVPDSGEAVSQLGVTIE